MAKLTKEIAYEALGNFFEEKPFVLFATGVSCALDQRFGMEALQAYLKASLIGLAPVQQQQWNSVLAQLEQGSCDFEAAMNQIQDDDLVQRIVNFTAECVRQVDSEYAADLLSGHQTWPAEKLFQRLFKSLSSGQSLHVATPNYDLLAEYALGKMNIPYLTGFVGGFCRQLDWKKAQRSVVVRSNKSVGRGIKSSFHLEKHLRLYKPHGSLNTFELNNSIVECDGWIDKPPKGISRFMVTPGSAKFEKLHENSNSLDAYRAAVKAHSAFLFLGFGFNDKHLVNDSFREKLQTQQCAALVITRSCNEQTLEWAKKSPNLWIVCKQEKNEFTRIYNAQYDDWLYLDNQQLWHFDQFASAILGV